MSLVTRAPVVGDDVFTALRRLYDRLDGVRELLTDGAVTSARLVVNPERLVVAEARRTFTYLSLYGYHVDAVIANRMLPEAIDDPWFDRWKAVQAEHFATIEEAFAPLPVLTADLAGHELVGLGRLSEFAGALYGPEAPAERLADVEPMRVEPKPGALVLSLHLPFAEKGDIELGCGDGELFLAVGPHRRAIVLPDSLLRREISGAHFAGDRLEVEFVEP